VRLRFQRPSRATAKTCGSACRATYAQSVEDLIALLTSAER